MFDFYGTRIYSYSSETSTMHHPSMGNLSQFSSSKNILFLRNDLNTNKTDLCSGLGLLFKYVSGSVNRICDYENDMSVPDNIQRHLVIAFYMRVSGSRYGKQSSSFLIRFGGFYSSVHRF